MFHFAPWDSIFFVMNPESLSVSQADDAGKTGLNTGLKPVNWLAIETSRLATRRAPRKWPDACSSSLLDDSKANELSGSTRNWKYIYLNEKVKQSVFRAERSSVADPEGSETFEWIRIWCEINVLKRAFFSDQIRYRSFRQLYFTFPCSVADPGCLSRILIFIHPGSRILDPWSNKSNKR